VFNVLPRSPLLPMVPYGPANKTLMEKLVAETSFFFDRLNGRIVN